MKKSEKKSTVSLNSIREYMNDVLSFEIFHSDPDFNNTPALEAYLHEGSCPLIVITGENASGKSLMRRIISMTHQESEAECIHLSQQGRSTSGVMRAFIYGSEDDESTGYNSAGCVLKAIQTSHGRNAKHSIFFDEPDIGLSDNYAAAVGIKIREFVLNPPEHLFAVFVVSHRKVLIEQLLSCDPWHLSMGDSPPLSIWLNNPVVPGDLEKLRELGIERWRRIQAYLNKLKLRKKKN